MVGELRCWADMVRWADLRLSLDCGGDFDEEEGFLGVLGGRGR